MNDAMQRMLPATVLTLALHGALLSWRMQLPETVQPKPLARKISVSLKRLPPPPPLQKIMHDTQALPQIAPVEHQPIQPLKLKPTKKIVQKLAPLPKIAQVEHQEIHPLKLKPGKKVSADLPSLPKLAPVVRQAIQPLAVQPVQQAVRPVIEPRPVVSRQQPVVRRTTTYQRTYQQPVRTRTQPTRHIPTTQATPPVSTAVVREAAPLYQSNPRPDYPRMARRRGLEGVVTIEARIDVDGRVADLRIFSGSGHSILDKAALKAVRNWRFSPGTVGGRAQAMWVKVPVRFELH